MDQDEEMKRGKVGLKNFKCGEGKRLLGGRHEKVFGSCEALMTRTLTSLGAA